MSSHQWIGMLALIVCALASGQAWTKNLGTFGEVFEIKEPDMETVIKQRAQEKMDSGEIPALQNQLRDNVKSQILRPIPVDGITRTVEPRTFHHDPTVVAQQDVVDANGTIIHPAGTRINPLVYKGLTRNILFFDGDDREQVEWVKRVSEVYQGQVKIIMTSGPIAQMMKELEMPVFFDQKGLLTSKFGIEHVPAIVSQDNLLLRIDEVRPSDI